MGRPKKVTKEVLEKLEEAFLLGCTDREACFYADIALSTLYLYQEQNPEFSERKAELKENPILLARKTVVENLARDPELSLKFLERKRKKEFSPRQEVTGKDGKPLGQASLSDEDKQKLDIIFARKIKADDKPSDSPEQPEQPDQPNDQGSGGSEGESVSS